MDGGVGGWMDTNSGVRNCLAQSREHRSIFLFEKKNLTQPIFLVILRSFLWQNSLKTPQLNELAFIEKK